MEALLVKILATALAFSQVTVTPHAIKTEFSRDRDQQQVAELLQAGCTDMIKSFQIENINLDDLSATAMDDPRALGDETRSSAASILPDLQTAYRQFCKHEPIEHTVIDLGAVIDYYNRAASDLPGHNKLQGLKLPGESIVLDIRRPFR